jgi:hypothetical protein
LSFERLQLGDLVQQIGQLAILNAGYFGAVIQSARKAGPGTSVVNPHSIPEGKRRPKQVIPEANYFYLLIVRTPDILARFAYTGRAAPACPPRTTVSAQGGTARTSMTLSMSRLCYAATVWSANSPYGLSQFKTRPPLIAVSLRELGAEQEDLGGIIDPYQNDDERARSAVG